MAISGSNFLVFDIAMAMRSNVPTFFLITLLCFLSPTTSQGASNDPANQDPGLNRHEELILLSCLGAVIVMSILIVLFLWYIVDRSNTRIRIIERHLPKIVEKMREGINVAVTELEVVENPQNMMAGTLAATEDFEGVHPLDIAGGRVRLTSYTRRKDIGIGTDFSENQTTVVIEPNNEERGESNGQENPTSISESKDFVFVNGEFVPRTESSVTEESKPPPPYAYDNPAYDSPHTENGTPGNGRVPLKKGKKDVRNQGKVKGKKKSKFSVYESHV